MWMQGFPVRGIFDVNPKLVGLEIRGQPIRDLDELEAICAQEAVKIGIITVPAGAAQAIANRLVASGVIGLFNFAPTDLKVPATIAVLNELITVGIMAISFKVKCLSQRGEDCETTSA